MGCMFCRSQAPHKEQMSPNSEGRLRRRTLCQAWWLVFTFLRENPKVALREGTPRPAGLTQGLSPQGLALCPQGATWTRACHSPVHCPGRGDSHGPLQVRNPAEETGKLSHPDPRGLQEAFESWGAAIAAGSRWGCKCGARTGSLSLRSLRLAAQRLRQDASSGQPPLRLPPRCCSEVPGRPLLGQSASGAPHNPA